MRRFVPLPVSSWQLARVGCRRRSPRGILPRANAALQAGQADKALALLHFPAPTSAEAHNLQLPRAFHARAV